MEQNIPTSWVYLKRSLPFLLGEPLKFPPPFSGSPGSAGKEFACNAGDLGSIPGLRRFPGEGNGNPLQYSCLENPIDRGAWQATVHRIAESDMTEVT